MRLLITGGLGFLGSHLVEHFLKTDCIGSYQSVEIIILDRLTYASNGFDRLRDIDLPEVGKSALQSSRVKVIGCDLSQPIQPGVIKELGEVDYVIHAAAETHVDNSIVDPLPFLTSNIIGTHHLLWAVKNSIPSVKRVFLVSTDEVYGPAPWNHPGFHEGDRFKPGNPYAASKAGAEALAMSYANTYKLPITVATTMNLYGERQHQEKYIPLVISKILRRETVYIHADATKTRAGSRFYLHCRNYASALEYLIKAEHDGMTLASKYHVSGEREVSNFELAQMIADMLGQSLSYELVDFHSSRPGHDLRYALNDDRIRNAGWRQPVNFIPSLTKTVRWYLNNQKWLGL